ncbi:hypothetical protein L210DRAFT_2210569 [Boletus edulis BED1]|uniref:Uncharacterized protein n=1 Tax=Boletus edulis BED1 TaxID=1328754 RepID=A0AAD4BST9_BOLED|nr:hypothetical protein L210DRAFT_2210569 [Boletus edulis BED1]
MVSYAHICQATATRLLDVIPEARQYCKYPPKETPTIEIRRSQRRLRGAFNANLTITLAMRLNSALISTFLLASAVLADFYREKQHPRFLTVSRNLSTLPPFNFHMTLTSGLVLCGLWS